MRCLETRKRDGYTYRLYRLEDGSTRQSYEITDPSVQMREVAALVRKARRSAAGRANLIPGQRKTTGISADPDRVDAVLADIENPELKVRDVCAKHGISTRTYYKIMRGA